MAFFLFILVNATLFIRPAEIIPEWQKLSIYEYLIVSCFVLALPEVLTYLTSRPLERQPITLCVFGILTAVVVSQLIALNLGDAWRSGFFFFKVVIYYLLLVSLLNTPARLRVFIGCLVWFCTVLALVTILQYEEVITLPTLKTLTESDVDEVTGDESTFGRMQGSGIFFDPND